VTDIDDEGHRARIYHEQAGLVRGPPRACRSGAGIDHIRVVTLDTRGALLRAARQERLPGLAVTRVSPAICLTSV
jgi:hypothetical protein